MPDPTPGAVAYAAYYAVRYPQHAVTDMLPWDTLLPVQQAAWEAAAQAAIAQAAIAQAGLLVLDLDPEEERHDA